MSGEGVVRAAPDQAWVRLAVESRAKQHKDAQAQNARTMAAVQEKLMAAGIPKDAVRTVSATLRPHTDFMGGKLQPIGFIAENSIEVRIDDIGRVGELVELAVASGANTVQSVRFDVKDRDALEREALKRATANARLRAEAAASGAGRAVDRVIRIEEPAARVVSTPAPVVMLEASESRQPPSIVAGDIEIKTTIVLTATLK